MCSASGSYIHTDVCAYKPPRCMHVRIECTYERMHPRILARSLARAAVRTPPRPWSPVMNDLRRLTLICHFISLIQPSRRTLCTAPISFHAAAHPRYSSSTTPRLVRLFLLLTLPRLPHAPRASHTRMPFSARATPLTNCFVGGAKKRRASVSRERKRVE